MRLRFLVVLLALLSFSFRAGGQTLKVCSGEVSTVAGVDTVMLWEGYDVRFGDEVMMLAYRPSAPDGTGVVVCPGGSYFWLDRRGEGTEVGEWLASKGITAFVLFYRTAGAAEYSWHTRLIFKGKRHPYMITDAQRALQWVCQNSDSYGLAPGRTGIMGFSAGGHLALSAACFSSTNFLSGVSDCSGETLCPDFVAAVYPVVTMKGKYVHKRSRRGLLGDSHNNRKMRDSLSVEDHIPADCPPVFLTNCVDDPVVDYRNSVLLDSALTSCGVTHRYIQYKTGRHGFGVSDYYGSPECRAWRDEFLCWLSTIGMRP